MKTIRILVALLTITLSAFVYAGPVNINTADAQTLSKNIKGVGLKKAQDIVAYREQFGNFRSIEQLGEVKGIGPATIERNRERIQVSLGQ